MRDDAPKSRGGHDEFDRDLRLTHKAISQAGNPAEQFFSTAWILNANYLIDFHGSGEKYQRSVVIDYDRIRLFRQGMLIGVTQSDRDWNPGLHTFTSAAILRTRIDGRHDGHGANVTSLCTILKFQGRSVPLEISHLCDDLLGS
jgi:hypothetical protein